MKRILVFLTVLIVFIFSCTSNSKLEETLKLSISSISDSKFKDYKLDSYEQKEKLIIKNDSVNVSYDVFECKLKNKNGDSIIETFYTTENGGKVVGIKSQCAPGQISIPCGGRWHCVYPGASCCGNVICGYKQICYNCNGTYYCGYAGASCCGTKLCGSGQVCRDGNCVYPR